MFQLKIKTKILKAMNRFASGDETRIIIRGVHVEAKRGGNLFLVATDGRRIGVLDIAESVDDDCQFTIPSEFIDALPDHGETELVYGPDTGEIHAQFTGYGIHAVAIEGKKGYSGQYPKWRQVVPSPWPKTFGNRNLAINMKLLAEVCDVAEQVCSKGHAGVTITSNGHEGDPVCIRRQNFTGIVMPLRPDASELHPPSFAL